MKKALLLALLCLTLGLTAAWADPVVGTTDPNAFTQDSIDWCQFGCGGGNFASPQPWNSAMGATGTVGLNGGFQDFWNLQQGSSWNGNFANGMGLVYNGAAFGNTPAGVVVTFDQAVWGVGAYIQADFYGPFAATITLFDQNLQAIGSYTANGVSDGNPGTALFIGASAPGGVWAAEFDVVDVNGNNDLAIGTLNFNTTPSVPEPGTLLMFGSSAVGLAGVLRRRFKGVL